MMNFILDHFKKSGIELVSPVPLSSCRVIRPDKLIRNGFKGVDGLTAIIIAVPYYVECREKNLSAYAIPRDYHHFFEQLFDLLLPILREKYPQYTFAGFADNSPIDEREAAAIAGLGIIGDNMMLITEKYSSYVFLGEIITDAPVPEAKAHPIKRCESCGACRLACPTKMSEKCLSSLTQKKGKLSEDEKSLLASHKSVWGCDVCQEVCPHTKNAIKRGSIFTNVDYFQKELIPRLTVEKLDRMSDEDFSLRAYAWRGRDVIRRNLLLAEEQTKN